MGEFSPMCGEFGLFDWDFWRAEFHDAEWAVSRNSILQIKLAARSSPLSRIHSGMFPCLRSGMEVFLLRSIMRA
jgi:hypothetical protein